MKPIQPYYSVEELLKSLSFEKAMLLSKVLLENEEFDYDIQEFAIQLIEKIRHTFPNEWNKDWRHEAYLGYSYSMLGSEIEKEFDAYAAAAEKSKSPPLEIKMHMALLWSYPGIYKRKMDESIAIKILEEVAHEIPYRGAVGGLIGLYGETKQYDKIPYGEKILQDSEEKDLFDKHTYLDFFNEY